MKRIPKSLWRWVHMSSYVLVWFAIVHAGLAGTDVRNRVYQAVAMVLTLAAVTAALIRVILGRPRARPNRPERAPRERPVPVDAP
jgi:DMSO/TMAO reductase YedYZ heme-binding membrane subunit